MNRLKRNPLLQVAKCEMCPNVVTNFVTGLCGRCSFMWTNKRNLIRATLGPYQLMAATVSMVRGIQDRQPMHPTFSQAIETIRSLRKQKVELFQKLRSHFLDSILIEQSYDQPVTTIVEDDYWNVPEIYDSDYIMFQHQIDLLEGVTRTLSANSDLNNNKVKEK
ncbi:uncharacterized protein [Drosophila kikkawai]|uniref:Uncharacterized protein n=1 Tax=Drosophila kikkawai TaxID=30033 RepID=A0A6P4JLK3_DROKI|nr:uncharacterized protein LOC108084011 [Drosophila kikkawai]KAH8337134.1 hypothetical protein KR059_000952 [Drosophila kikkawai]